MSDDLAERCISLGQVLEEQWLLDAGHEIARLRALVGLESPDLDLDWNRLRSGDNRALLAGHQDVFDLVSGMRDEIERLRAHIAEIEAWRQQGEDLLAPASSWGEYLPSSTLFKLGNWWALRPWR